MHAPRSLEIPNVSLDTCLSSSVSELRLNLDRYEDCFALLDGRLRNLTKLTVDLNYFEYDFSAANEIVSGDLVHIKRLTLSSSFLYLERVTQHEVFFIVMCLSHL